MKATPAMKAARQRLRAKKRRRENADKRLFAAAYDCVETGGQEPYATKLRQAAERYCAAWGYFHD